MIFDCTERYDPVTKQWASVASLNFPRCGVGVCPCHGALYALGNRHGRSTSTRGAALDRTHPSAQTHRWLDWVRDRENDGALRPRGEQVGGHRHHGGPALLLWMLRAARYDHLPAFRRPSMTVDALQ